MLANTWKIALISPRETEEGRKRQKDRHLNKPLNAEKVLDKTQHLSSKVSTLEIKRQLLQLIKNIYKKPMVELFLISRGINVLQQILSSTPHLKS